MLRVIKPAFIDLLCVNFFRRRWSCVAIIRRQSL